MARPDNELERAFIYLYPGDKDRLMAYFPNMSVSQSIRELVHGYLRQMDERHSRAQDKIDKEILNEL